ncbi:hypothetical protein [Moellerella wisconsensis]|uniref:hypothetical protein n=1 Tax=Moellerella wisconsensis TaxID=158849 RepID=UPI000640BEF0|nr:hypothetical protein [Moellerella wisconsensis]KLN95639.1 hypothetical protein VK86_14095 [Moellerella wisconsensis]
MPIFKKENVKIDLYYASGKHEESGSKVAEATILINNREDNTEIAAITLRRATDKARKQTYGMGSVRMEFGADKFTNAVHQHFCADIEKRFKEVMSEVNDFFESGLDSSTWIGAFGLKIFSDAEAGALLPESVINLLTDGTAEVTE